MSRSVEARFQTRLEDDACRCELCPRHCVIEVGQSGFCSHRSNENGRLIAAQYGQVAALGIDPIEKKPLYHFHPGKGILSAGANGCNLACRFCQNWHLSTGQASSRYVSPEELVAQAGTRGSIGVSFTYNEPMIWFEYILDTATLLQQRGLANVLVTNGYLEAEPFDELIRWVDAMNVDVKGNAEFYEKMAGGKLAPVRRNVEAAVRAGVHVEVTNLLVTDANDTEQQVRDLVDWLAGVSAEVPLHISRYFPNHRYHAEATSMAKLEMAVRIAKEKLHYVFAGNAHLEGAADTCCPHCGETVIARSGYRTGTGGLASGGKCAACGQDLKIIN